MLSNLRAAHTILRRHPAPTFPLWAALLAIFQASACSPAVSVVQNDRLALSACDAVIRNAPPVDTALLRYETPGPYELFAAKVPGGFSGLRSDSLTGQLIVMLTDTSQLSAARNFLVDAYRRGEPGFARGWGTESQLAATRAERVTWSLEDLHAWHRFLTPLLLQPGSGANVVGFGINTLTNSITVTTGDETSRAAIQARLASLNIPCGLVITDIGGPIHTD